MVIIGEYENLSNIFKRNNFNICRSHKFCLRFSRFYNVDFDSFDGYHGFPETIKLSQILSRIWKILRPLNLKDRFWFSNYFHKVLQDLARFSLLPKLTKNFHISKWKLSPCRAFQEIFFKVTQFFGLCRSFAN